jgi:hypothetical protein
LASYRRREAETTVQSTWRHDRNPSRAGIVMAGRRRIDRVTADDYLHGLAEHPLADLRGMRDECREEETALSYSRRMLQARLDLARAEASRREEPNADGDLSGAVASTLADQPTGRGSARATGFYDPQANRGRRAGDELVGDASLGQLPDLEDAELGQLIERLEAEERRVSELRRTVLDHLDRLQDELVSRYRAEGAPVDELLSSGERGNGGSGAAADGGDPA